MKMLRMAFGKLHGISMVVLVVFFPPPLCRLRCTTEDILAECGDQARENLKQKSFSQRKTLCVLRLAEWET